MKALFIIATLMLSACSTIDAHTPAPSGWPALRIVIVDDPYADKGIEVYCSPSNLFAYHMACAVPDFAQQTCFIYARSRDKWLIDHEKLHCAGYDHPGGSSIRKIMNYWKSQGWKPQ